MSDEKKLNTLYAIAHHIDDGPLTASEKAVVDWAYERLRTQSPSEAAPAIVSEEEIQKAAQRLNPFENHNGWGRETWASGFEVGGSWTKTRMRELALQHTTEIESAKPAEGHACPYAVGEDCDSSFEISRARERIAELEKEEQAMIARLHTQSRIMAELERERDELKAEVERLHQHPFVIDDLYKKSLAEVDRLRRVIAQELSENDELGCEYTYVIALKERVAELERNKCEQYDHHYKTCEVENGLLTQRIAELEAELLSKVNELELCTKRNAALSEARSGLEHIKLMSDCGVTYDAYYAAEEALAKIDAIIGGEE